MRMGVGYKINRKIIIIVIIILYNKLNYRKLIDRLYSTCDDKSQLHVIGSDRVIPCTSTNNKLMIT